MLEDIPISVVSWNCLADCYSRGPCAQKSDIDVVSWSYRSSLINRILSLQDADIVCLQEVDHFEDHFKPFFIAHNYHVEYIQRSNRQDGLLIAFKKNKFYLLHKHVIQFDDLSRIKPVPRPLTNASLRKQNVALVLSLQSQMSHHSDTNADHSKDRAFTVCTTHLYWNPHFPHVKLAQTHYLLERLVNMRHNVHGLPSCATLLTGDFNSEPTSQQYAAVTCGRPIHPIVRQDAMFAAKNAVSTVLVRRRSSIGVPMKEKEYDMISGEFPRLGLDDGEDDDEETRFLCDTTLTKLARWLRLLGVDTAIEDRASQERRAFYNDFDPLFSRVRSERRILVTTSTNMQKRRMCPETFLIRTSSSNTELKESVASLINHYDVSLNKSLVFTMCGKCGGSIVSTHVDDVRFGGKFAPTDRKIFICEDCHQPYWFSKRSEGSSSRARTLAYSLFSYVEASKRKRKNGCNNRNGDVDINTLVRKPLPSADSCKQQWLKFQSAFTQVHGREPECTNINSPYRGTLDYIFVGGALKANLAVTHRHHDPESKSNDELFPNTNWPSDHLLLRADLLLQTSRTGRSWFSRTLSAM